MGFGLPISYLTTMIIGLPIYHLLEKNGLLSSSWLMCSGAIVGALILNLFFYSVSTPGGLNVKETVQIAFLGMAMGSSIAFVFGKLAGVGK